MRTRFFVTVLAACSLGVLTGCPPRADLGSDSGDNGTHRPHDSVAPGSNDSADPTTDDSTEHDNGGVMTTDDDANPDNVDAPTTDDNVNTDNGDIPAINDDANPDNGGVAEPVDNGDPAPVEDANADAAIPAELTGKWITVLTYLPAFYTGLIPVDNVISSIGVSYTFGADGQYRYDLDSAMSYFNGICFRSTSWIEFGTVSVDGPAITLTPTRAAKSKYDSCDEFKFEDHVPADTVTLTVTPDVGADGWPMLRIQLPSGEELLMEKCRTCQ